MISHYHKCVFVHIPKCAGQSIEHVFLGLLGLDWKIRAPLLLQHNDQPKLGPPKLAHLQWREYVDCRYLTQEQFDSYFKFSFVRDPWSRIVSMYQYLGVHGHHQNYDFKDFLVNDLRKRLWHEMYWFVAPQSDFIYDAEERLKVDFVGRVERLQADFDQICDKIGLPATQVPHVNSSRKPVSDSSGSRPGYFRRWHRPRTFSKFASFCEYYDAESIELVAHIYSRDLRLLGYDSAIVA